MKSSLVILSLLSTLTTVSADMLQLKDGTVHTGTYAGGKISTVRFEIGDEIKTFPVDQVAAITFGGDAGSGAASAPAASAAPAAAAQTSYAASGGAIAAGTPLVVSLGQELDSSTAQIGQTFSGTLVSPLTVGNQVVAPAGSKVQGTVTEVHQARRLLGRNASLSFSLTTLVVDGKEYPISTNAQSENVRGQGMIGEAAKGAARGATWGAIADDNDVGNDALAGMASSAVGGVLRKPEQVVYKQGTILSFDLTSPVTLE